MRPEDEGCPLAQLIVVFDNHKITFYAVDFIFFTVEHNKDKGYSRMNNYSILYFMIADNQLYPIEDKHVQLSISQINKCGGKPYIPAPKELVKPDNNTYRFCTSYHICGVSCKILNTKDTASYVQNLDG